MRSRTHRTRYIVLAARYLHGMGFKTGSNSKGHFVKIGWLEGIAKLCGVACSAEFDDPWDAIHNFLDSCEQLEPMTDWFMQEMNSWLPPAEDRYAIKPPYFIDTYLHADCKLLKQCRAESYARAHAVLVGGQKERKFQKSRRAGLSPRLRYSVLKRANGACQLCGATACTGALLEIDHIKPVSLHPELALDIENLQVLCKNCNAGKSNKDSTDWRMNADTDRGREGSGNSAGLDR